MLIESVKRWAIVALMITVALLVLLIMAMLVDAQSMQSKVTTLEITNQSLLDTAKHNADQVRTMYADAKANDALESSKQKAKAEASKRTRSNAYVVHQTLSTESCSTVRLPGSTVSMLQSSGSNQGGNTLPNSTSSTDP